MRSTLEIIVAVKESQPATEEELRLALVAMSAVDYFLEKELRGLAESVAEGKPTARMKAGLAIDLLGRIFDAKKQPPDEWLLPDNTPGTPEYQKRLEAGKRLFKKATGQDL